MAAAPSSLEEQLPGHKVAGVEEAIRAAGAMLFFAVLARAQPHRRSVKRGLIVNTKSRGALFCHYPLLKTAFRQRGLKFLNYRHRWAAMWEIKA